MELLAGLVLVGSGDALESYMAGGAAAGVLPAARKREREREFLKKKMEDEGIDPPNSRMLSARSTI